MTYATVFHPPHPTISIHTPARGVTAVAVDTWIRRAFQSTLPQGEWPCLLIWTLPIYQFQSTLPQGEWLICFTHCVVSFHISIHTPARGVTTSQLRECKASCISIHTPARGVTRICIRKLSNYIYFNPHSRKGSDRQTRWKWKCNFISIHTPARGVTISEKWHGIELLFQSTLPQGEWRIFANSHGKMYIFQSTLPQGEWHKLIYEEDRKYAFQSTLPQGEWLWKY